MKPPLDYLLEQKKYLKSFLSFSKSCTICRMQLSFPLLFLKAPQINKFGAIKEEAGEGLGRRDQIDYTYVVAASPPSSVFEKRRKKTFQ